MRLIPFRVVVFVCALATHAALAGSLVYPPGTPIDGRSLATLTGAWWNWYEGLSDGSLDRPDGTGCAIHQQGDIWFLAGTSKSSPSRRTCRLPPGKMLLFPMVNTFSFDRPGKPNTCGELRSITTAIANTANGLFITLDGETVEEPAAHRIATPTCFTLDATGTAAASDGYWIVLRPLSKGHHELTFGGAFDYGRSSVGQLRQDNRYDLYVE